MLQKEQNVIAGECKNKKVYLEEMGWYMKETYVINYSETNLRAPDRQVMLSQIIHGWSSVDGCEDDTTTMPLFPQ